MEHNTTTLKLIATLYTNKTSALKKLRKYLVKYEKIRISRYYVSMSDTIVTIQYKRIDQAYTMTDYFYQYELQSFIRINKIKKIL